MLEVKNLKSGYSGVEILHGVNLVIKPGELVALIGPNGAGKSTILKSIFNLAEIYDGKIVFKDKDITRLKTHELIELGISYVPQGRQVFPNMTVLENLQMGAYSIQDQNVIETNINDVFQKFPDLLQKQQESAGVLSGGQQQMLAIARALIQNPQLLLLDEPSLGLSPKLIKEIFEKIIEIKDKGVAILMVEQNARQAVGIANRTYILENGAVVLEGNKTILDNKQVENIYFGGEIALKPI